MTKRRDLLKAIRVFAKQTNQEIVIKEGSNHTRIWVGEKYTTIPRHVEIPDRFAKTILKQLGVQ